MEAHQRKGTSGLRPSTPRMGDPMRQAIFTKKPDATLEENMEYVLNKVDYLLRKVEIYDKAINEFNELKLTIEEAKENTRHNKDVIRSVKDSIDTNSRDTQCLSEFSKSLMDRLDTKLEFLTKRIDDLDERTYEDDACLELKISNLRDETQQDLESYLDTDDLGDIKEIIEQKNRYFEFLISNVHHNYLNVDRQLCELSAWKDGSAEMFSSIKKDLCRFQNALVRKGVPIDNQ